MKTEMQLQIAVVARLRELGVDCSLEYPGYVNIPAGPTHWEFGTANQTWCGDHKDNADCDLGGAVTDIPSDSEDIERITKAIIATVAGRPAA